MVGLQDADLDGDGVADPIETTFTGGAHCCYLLAVRVSSTATTVRLPFEIDGGYVFGLDLSQPERFNIADYDGDGIVEVCTEIATYNGERAPIPARWTSTYGIRTNVVTISFARGLVVRDRAAASCAP